MADRRRRISVVAMGLALMAWTAGWSSPAPAAAAQPAPRPAAVTHPAAATPDWLSEINTYRAAAGLASVSDQPAWDSGLQAHLTYLADTPASYYTGQYQSLHTENPASPYYTAAGATEASRSDLFLGAVGWAPLQLIDGWLAAPFHAIGMLRAQLTQVAFASNPTTGDAGLDVIGGLDYSQPLPTTPVLFPGPGMTTDLVAGGGESPDPLETCGWTGLTVGLPLIALLPNDPSATLSASVTGPDGTVQSTANGNLCVVDDHTYHSSDPVYGPTGESILEGDRAVLLIARSPYSWGRYQARITQSGQAAVSWSFISAPPGPVAAGHAYTVHVGSGSETVLGNLTVTDAQGAGFTTVYPCAAGRPLASNSNYVAGQTVANFVAVQADVNGDVCVFTSASSDLVWDQTGEEASLPVHNATRLLDTRSGARPGAGSVTQVHAASGSETVLGNLTVTDAQGAGFTTVYPCAAGRPLASNSNYVAGQTVANFVAVQADVNGDVCVFTSASSDLVWDQTGEEASLPVHNATRLLDTRSGARPGAGSVTQVHAASGSETVLGNLTVTDAQGAGFTTVYPCAAGRPLASNSNYVAGQTVANFVAVQADVNGDVCVFTSASSDLVWDQTGEEASLPVHNATRLFDTRAPAARLG